MSSEARLFINITSLALTWGALLGACIFAWIKGRTAERYGASLYFFSAAATMGVSIATGQDLPIVPDLLFDAAVAFGFLALAIRYNNLWLGAALLLKGIQLAMHATRLTDEADPYIGKVNLYIVSLDLISFFISMTILGGTLSSLRERRRARIASAARPLSGSTAPSAG